MMNCVLKNVVSRIKTNKILLSVFLTSLTILTVIGPVLAEGATGSSG